MDETETAPTLSHSTFLRIAFEALSVRVGRWIALLMSFGLFVAAVWYPDWKRLTAAAGFTLLVWLPMHFKKEK